MPTAKALKRYALLSSPWWRTLAKWRNLTRRTSSDQELTSNGWTHLSRCVGRGWGKIVTRLVDWLNNVQHPLSKEVRTEAPILVEFILQSVLNAGLFGVEDIPEDCPISVYSLNEIATEKVVALQDRVRNEPRDLYDLWFLASDAGVEMGHLIGAITEKSAFGKEILLASKPASSQKKLA